MVEQPESSTEPDDGGPKEAADRPAEPREAVPRRTGPVPRPDPTRYGDWEKDGRCIDF